MKSDRLGATRAGLPGWALAVGVLLLLIGLPLAVWLDLRNLAEQSLRWQANDLNSVITQRARLLCQQRRRRASWPPGADRRSSHNYADVPGAIPIPATLSLELGSVISEQQQQHHLPLRLRLSRSRTAQPHALDDFERDALATLREQSRPAGHRGRQARCSTDTRAAGRAGDHGRSLRQLPQHASRKPEARLEGRRRARHPGGHRHAADRRQHLLVQVPARLLRASWRSPASRFIVLQRRQAATDPRHEPASSRPPTNSSPRCR